MNQSKSKPGVGLGLGLVHLLHAVFPLGHIGSILLLIRPRVLAGIRLVRGLLGSLLSLLGVLLLLVIGFLLGPSCRRGRLVLLIFFLFLVAAAGSSRRFPVTASGCFVLRL